MTTLRAATQARAGLVMGGYKYIRSEAPGGPREEVYRLPDEVRNLAHTLPDLAQKLRAELGSWHRATPALAATDEPELSHSDIEALRALGYLEE